MTRRDLFKAIAALPFVSWAFPKLIPPTNFTDLRSDGAIWKITELHSQGGMDYRFFLNDENVTNTLNWIKRKESSHGQ